MANSPLLWFGNACKFLKSQLVIPGSTSGALTVQPAAATTDYTLTMPATQGGASTVLTNDGSGALSWGSSGGATVTAWAAYTPTLSASFGTTSSVSFFWRRVGDTLYVRGNFHNGTNSTALGSISIPSTLNIDTAKIPASTSTVQASPLAGTWWGEGANNLGALLICATTSTTLVYVSPSNNLGQLTPGNLTNFWSNNQTNTVEFQLPISGW